MSATIGAIRVLTTENPDLLAARGRIIDRRFGLHTISRCIPDQWKGIYDDETEAIAVHKIIHLGKELTKEDVDAIVEGCAAERGRCRRAGAGLDSVGAVVSRY